ncbi:uncharacterized protein L201_005438 [Kwoniella dendrophila CBS 6074]|uniref:NAD(P)-binding protein n=1 Tax=Kwoniella dendrophila CBS 6074 TaxID=1295534 RepID=A0AAX4JZ08_9TREE
MSWAYFNAIKEILPPKPTWSVDDLPDQTGNVAIVTGGNTGIGKAICEVLLRKNAKVYLLARSEDKALEAIKDLKEQTGKKDIHFIKLDLGDLTTIKSTVKEFETKEENLHLLFNNAGVMFPPNGSKTKQGYELQLGTNSLGPILLTNLLLPILIKTSQSLLVKNEVKEKGYNIIRIINLSSNGHVFFPPKGGFNFLNPNFDFLDSKSSYGQSKFLNVIHSLVIAKEMKKNNYNINCHPSNPGGIKSDLHRYQNWLYHLFVDRLTYPLDLGRMTPLYAGLSPEAGKPDQNGSYYIPWGRKGSANPDACDEENTEKM